MTKYELMTKQIDLLQSTEYDCLQRGSDLMAQEWANLKAKLIRERDALSVDEAEKLVP